MIYILTANTTYNSAGVEQQNIRRVLSCLTSHMCTLTHLRLEPVLPELLFGVHIWLSAVGISGVGVAEGKSVRGES